MVKVKPFAAIRPPKALVKEVASRPYDVLSSEEAKAEAGEKSLLHIIKPEIDFDPIAEEQDPRVYEKAVENFKLWQQRGWLVQDAKECYYVYAQTMGSRTQYGLVVCANVEDYMSGAIKKHELTRKDKEDDRMKHVRIQSANLEPVFFAYPDNAAIDAIVARYTAKPAEYDFVADDSFGHKLWVIDDPKDIEAITAAFASIPAFYVADGHHRTAAAARVGAERKENNPAHDGSEEYNYFMAVVFPQSHLKIMEINRLVKDLDGLTPEELIAALKKNFVVEEAGCSGPYRPCRLHNFAMYLAGKWYSLTAKEGTYDDNDPIGKLDVTVLSNLVLQDILHIGDLRTSNRIEFPGGIRGLEELQRRVDSGEMAVAFALYPVTMEQLVSIADTGNIMPPKTTWFEPKLRSGITIHKF